MLLLKQIDISLGIGSLLIQKLSVDLQPFFLDTLKSFYAFVDSVKGFLSGFSDLFFQQ